MPLSFRPFSRATAAGFAAFALVFILTQFLTYQRYRIHREEHSKKILHEINSVTSRLKTTLSYSLSATHTLAFIVERYGIPQDFDSIAKDILASHQYIDALELTRQGVITNIYPVQGHEKAIGFDILNDEASRQEALRSIAENRLFFAGPLTLQQGGKAVVGRLPIVIDNSFYGFSVVLIRLPTLLRAIGIDQADGEFVYQLSKVNPQTNVEEYFLSNDISGFKPELSAFVEVPDGEWRLYVSMREQSFLYNVLALSILGLSLAVAVGLLMHNWARSHDDLRFLVDQKTSLLGVKELSYHTTLARISDAFLTVDPGYKLEYMNNKAEMLFGTKLTKVQGQVIWDIFPDLVHSPLPQGFSQALLEQKQVSIDFCLQPVSHWLEASVYPSTNGLTVFMRDVTEQRSAQAKLQASEKHFRALVENSSEAIVLLTATGEVIYQTPSVTDILGYSQHELRQMDQIELIHPDEREDDAECFRRVVSSPGKPIVRRHRVRHRLGHYLWIEGIYTNWLIDENVRAIVYNYHDITDRVVAEKKIASAKRLYHVISRINHTIVRADNEHDLFSEVCRIAVNIGNFRMAWIGLLNASTGSVTAVSWSGAEEGYLTSIQPINIKDEVLGQGPTGVAITSGRYYICNDISRDDRMQPWRHEALKRNFQSSISLPIKKFSEVIGIFVLYSDKVMHFDEQEVNLLEEVTNDISFSLENQERERLRIAAEQEARNANKEKEMTLNRISDSVISLDTHWRYVFLNNAAIDTHPEGKEGVLGKTIWEVHPEVIGTIFESGYRQAMEELCVVEIEDYYPPMDRWFMVKAYPSKDGLTIFYKDVSERKKYEKEIVQSRSILQAILENTSDMIWSIDHDYKILFCNTHFRQFVLRLSGKVIEVGADVRDFIPIEIRSDVIGLCERARDGERFSAERKRTFFEKTMDIEYFFNPITGGDGVVHGIATFMRDISDRKKNEAQILAERNLSAHIINSLPGIFYLYDRQRVFKRWNKNFEEISGYSGDEIVAMNPLQFFDAEEKDLLDAKINEVFRRGASEVSAHLYTKDAKRIPYFFSGRMAMLDGNEYLIGMGIDITDRVEAERALREHSDEIQKLSLVASTTDNLVAIMDASGRIEWINQSFSVVTGYQSHEIAGQSLMELLRGPDTDKHAYDLVQTNLSKGLAVFEEIVCYARNGRKIWLRTNINPVRDEGGNVVQFISVQSDVTAQKEYENNITMLARELTNLIENANAVIFGVDVDGKVTEWNMQAILTTGFGKADMVGKKLTDILVAREKNRDLERTLKFVLEGNNVLHEEFQVVTKAGEKCILLLSATPRRNPSGETIGVIAVGQDITELTAYRTSLEEKVKSRTDELNAALEREKELSVLKTRFASMVSHEFRTPLATIRLSVNHIKRYKQRLSAEAIDSKINTVLSQVDHMSHLLEDVLTLGKTEDVKIQIHRTSVHLSAFCKQIREQVEQVFEKSHVIECSLQFENDMVETDEDLLRNIFVNLLGNAIKFSPGRKRVYFSGCEQANEIVFEVRDEGIGIPDADLQKIFQPFDRGTNVGGIAGTGLGLSIVKKAIDLLGGQIEVDSEVGRGTTFRVRLKRGGDTQM